eukprot:1159589-Pelagomonas_calceolata.AAC.7
MKGNDMGSFPFQPEPSTTLPKPGKGFAIAQAQKTTLKCSVLGLNGVMEQVLQLETGHASTSCCCKWHTSKELCAERNKKQKTSSNMRAS